MSTAARLAISAWRNDDVFELPMQITGLDVTNLALAMQIRLRADTPGPPLVDLAKVTNGNAQGLRVASVALANGVPVSDVRIRINKTTMQALPYAGEIGSSAVLEYALLIAGFTRIVGTFEVLAHPYGSDNAPANRPSGYGGSAVGAGSSGATFQFGDQVVQVSIVGVEQVAALVGAAKTQADRSAASASTAKTSEVAGAASANASSQSAAASLLSANVAGQYRQAIEQAAAALPAAAILMLQASSREMIAAFAGQEQGRQTYLTEAGCEGPWMRDRTLDASLFNNDLRRALFIKSPNEPGGWRRVIPQAGGRAQVQISWLGFGPDATNTAAALEAFGSLIPENSDVVWVNYRLYSTAPGQPRVRVVWYTRGTRIIGSPGLSRFEGFFWLAHSGQRVTGMDVEMDRSAQVAQNNAAIIAGTTQTPTARDVVGIEVDHCKLTSSIGFIAINDVRDVDGVQKIAGTVSQINAHHNYIYADAQGVSLFLASDGACEDNTIYLTIPDPFTFHAGIRINGLQKGRVRRNTIHVVSKDKNFGWGIYVSASANGQQRSLQTVNRDLDIADNITFGCATHYELNECLGFCNITRATMVNDITETRRVNAFLFDSPGPQSPVGAVNVRFEHIRITGAKAIGVSHGITGNLDCRTIDASDNSFLGNARTYANSNDTSAPIDVLTTNPTGMVARYANNEFLLKPGATNIALMFRTVDADIITAVGNRVPEDSIVLVSKTGTGTLILTPNTPGTKAVGDLVGETNYRLPAGSYAVASAPGQ